MERCQPATVAAMLELLEPRAVLRACHGKRQARQDAVQLSPEAHYWPPQLQDYVAQIPWSGPMKVSPHPRHGRMTPIEGLAESAAMSTHDIVAEACRVLYDC